MIVSALSILACATAPTDGAGRRVSLRGDYGEPRIIVPAPKDERLAHLAWPKVVVSSEGTIVVGYIAGRFHGNHGEGCPAVSVSADGGKSFTRPHVLKRYGAEDAYTSAGNLAMGLAGDGTVVLLSMAFNATKANTIDGWRSSDEGRTWQGVDVSRLADSRTGSVYGHVLPLPEHRLAVVGHYRQGSRTQPVGLWIAHSCDHGRTWSAPRTITDRKLFEPAVVFTDDRYIGLVRHPARLPFYALVTSRDRGETWRLIERGLIVKGAGRSYLPSPCLVVDPQDPTRLYALASQRGTGEGLIGKIELWTAETKTLRWRRLGVVARFPKSLGERGDITYGWMAPTTGRNWFVVFYCGQKRGPSDIYGLPIAIERPSRVRPRPAHLWKPSSPSWRE